MNHLKSLAFVALACMSTAHAHDVNKSAKDATPSTAVQIMGAVKMPTDFSVVALRQMTGQDTGKMPVVCASVATVATVKNFRGVRLIDVQLRISA